MLKRNVDLRVESVTAAAEIRQLKTEERRALKAARHIKQRNNFTNTDAAMSYASHRSVYLERMACRREARLLHLTRMLLKGRDYRTVEAVTHSCVSVSELADRVWQWEPSVSEEFVYDWLNYDESF